MACLHIVCTLELKTEGEKLGAGVCNAPRARRRAYGTNWAGFYGGLVRCPLLAGQKCMHGGSGIWARLELVAHSDGLRSRGCAAAARSIQLFNAAAGRRAKDDTLPPAARRSRGGPAAAGASHVYNNWL